MKLYPFQQKICDMLFENKESKTFRAVMYSRQQGRTEASKDVWLSPEQACKVLGDGWTVSIQRDCIHKLNEYGVALSSRRIFTGDEHPLAQPGKVVLTQGEFVPLRAK